MADFLRSGLTRLFKLLWTASPSPLTTPPPSSAPATQVEPDITDSVDQPLTQASLKPPRSTISKGWGDRIQWLGLSEAYAAARSTNKPMMVVVHKMSCGACLYQKRWFSASKDVEALSKDLVMVNLEIHQLPRDPQFTPDGLYVPRILFFSPGGRLLPEVKVKYLDEYMYSYPTEWDLINNMRTVINQNKTSKPS